MPAKSAIPLFNVNSITEFIKVIEENCKSEYFLFRGQREDWELSPKIARIIPKGSTSLLEAESKMLDDFKRTARPFLGIVPKNDWEWLALAQHHGMATRLLDWTTNPLAALWFAVEKPATTDFGIVWAFDAPEVDIIMPKHVNGNIPFAGPKTKVFQPEISTARIQSQNGWFTVHKYVVSKRRFISFEKNSSYRKYLLKIKVPSAFFNDLRYQLDRLGINRLSLFPDLEGAANHAEWINTFLTDEVH